MVSAEQGGRALYELCKRDGATVERIRTVTPFMKPLRVTQRCLVLRYGGDQVLWPEAAYDVLDCVTSAANGITFGRRASRFMRACLGLDGEMGGIEQRMRELQNTPFEFPTSTNALRKARLAGMIRLSRTLHRMTDYDCASRGTDDYEEDLRIVRLMSKFSRMFAYAVNSDAGVDHINVQLEQLRFEIPNLMDLVLSSPELEPSVDRWNKFMSFIGQAIFKDVTEILNSRGYGLRSADVVTWSLRIIRTSGKRAVEEYRGDISMAALAASLVYLETLFLGDLGRDWVSWRYFDPYTPYVDREALANLVEDFIGKKDDLVLV